MASEYKQGDIVAFKDYEDSAKAAEGFVAILEPGQTLRIEKVGDDGSLIVVAIDEEGAAILGDDNKPVADQVFPEEVEELAGDEATEETDTDGASATDAATAEEAAPAKTEAPAPAGKRAAGTGKAKPAAAVKEKAPTAAEKKAKEKADAKAAAEKAKADAAAKKLADKEAADKAKADAKAAKEAEKQKKAEAKLATPDNDDPLMIRVDETKTVTEILKDQSALEAAKMLVNRSEQTDFTLGGVLHNIYVTGAFKSIGYDGKRGFSDYVESELGVQYRKARYLITIYTTFAQVFRAKGITEDDLLKLGWSKAKELARIPVNKLVEDYDKLIAMAVDKEKSRDDLIAHIKDNYEVVQREETVKAIDLKFRLVADAADVVNQALEKAKGLVGEGADLNKALEYMAGDWLNTAASETTMTLQSLIDLASAQFGVTLVAAEEGSTSEAGEVAEQAA
ncbi:hypothetical protein CC53_gp074 [Rhizobium phage vB_RleS_L338C]|uniref:hypothetical protein n=1 Tax=Rhizobium phage vB_RleS_L338C TaxID=1414737 RepID=UPI0003D8F688|nr:hypothetical protein CC53_gp074 [Rhizobium phage vB_RleS_L338C]AHC30491.1 hypothetical protein L338C_074 [Rhizobium phage vB_RleS_L338C]QNH72048.1 hypothetical protein P11VFA_072 [Rhizobium phage P11VFA]